MAAPIGAPDVPADVRLTVADVATVVRVDGSVDLAVVDELRAVLDEAVVLRPYVIVDLTTAMAIDSLGLGTLIRTRNVARRGGGDVLLVGPSPFLRTMLGALRAHTAFAVYETVPQAMSAAHRRPSHAG
ncbi:STAS domain-containing protein [Actinoplanes sp. NPDC023714]|uniref:STAS domain-containing protein n=1 Tax=Actinoplanes sp. NPDC023714 TaxID=3154322 RepID=UPI0033E996DF